MDQSKLEAFMGQIASEFSVLMSGVLVSIGHKLGLYKAMDGAGAITAKDLADKTGCSPRYIQEWLNNQAAGGYVEYDAQNKTYELPPEHAMVLAREGGPTFFVPGFDVVSSVWLDEEKIAEVFKTGEGLGWHQHHPRLFSGNAAFFRANYVDNLIANWIPAVDGLEAKMKAGAKVADIGCGYGVSTVLMAQAFPNSTFCGFDYHDASIDAARALAEEAGVGDRVRFEVATAKDFAGEDYDLVCFFDCFHDLGDPRGAAAYARSKLKADGAVLMVEPQAGDNVEDNLNPVGRLYCAASTAVCCPNSLSQEGGAALGAQAGETRLASLLKEAGYSNVRRATETPFNMVLEARP